MSALVEISRKLTRRLAELRFEAPVATVYNPLTYARSPHELYLSTYGGEARGVVLLVGMNPGPYGMAQTGVPFGDISMVRDWLGVSGTVERPDPEHPKRPIQGFDCQRREVSGARLWGWARDRFRTPAAFFQRFFVVNYCPLCFMDSAGRNLTPDRLPSRERGPLFEPCDEALRATVVALAPRLVIGVGGFAEDRARIALAQAQMPTPVGAILHPSPASPAANRGWAAQAEAQLRSLGVELPF